MLHRLVKSTFSMIKAPRDKGRGDNGVKKSQAQTLEKITKEMPSANAVQLAFPTFEGVHDAYNVPLLVQMKMHARATTSDYDRWIAAMYCYATKSLHLAEGKYFCVLYTTATSPSPLEAQYAPRRGTAIVGPDALHKLLAPLGNTCLLQQRESPSRRKQQGK